MTSLAFGRPRALLVSVLGSSVLAMLPLASGCGDDSGAREKEDKDGVNEVPSPNGPSGGPSGGLGGANEGGAGGGTAGMPCMTGVECEDGDPCTTNTCTGGACVTTNPADDGNLCTEDVCDPMTGEVSNPVKMPMNDGNVCTIDVCDPATGNLNNEFIRLFFDSFADNSQGWALGAEWQIGSANPSMGALNGGNDPDFDFSMSDDDGVAGTVLGGLIADTTHDFQYLTSPAINVATTGAVGEVVELRFHRWLNTDGASSDVIEVFDGTAWQEVWRLDDALIIDAPDAGLGWTPVSVDISGPVATARGLGAPIRVRFGFDHTATGAATAGGWNLDDLSVERRSGDPICP